MHTRFSLLLVFVPTTSRINHSSNDMLILNFQLSVLTYCNILLFCISSYENEPCEGNTFTFIQLLTFKCLTHSVFSFVKV